jgi:hypothetical protein
MTAINKLIYLLSDNQGYHTVFGDAESSGLQQSCPILSFGTNRRPTGQHDGFTGILQTIN